MIHKKTGKYYIGSSKNIESRKNSHMSFFRSGRNHKKLQELYDIDNEFEFFILEECRTCDLKKKEEKYLKQCVGFDSRCMNIVSTGVANLRNKKKREEHKLRLAVSMFGKNGKSRLSKSTKLISPDNKEYNVVSIRSFAKKHNLSQSALNDVANGKVKHHRGWRLSGTTLEECGLVRPDLEIVNPDGNVVVVNNIRSFESQHNIRVYGKYTVNKKFVRPHDSLDKYGRGWYVKGNIPSYTFENTKTGEIIENVISTPVFGKTFNIPQRHIASLISGRRKCTHSGWIVRRFIINKIEVNGYD